VVVFGPVRCNNRPVKGKWSCGAIANGISMVFLNSFSAYEIFLQLWLFIIIMGTNRSKLAHAGTTKTSIRVRQSLGYLALLPWHINTPLKI
jgi:hypothetical protein